MTKESIIEELVIEHIKILERQKVNLEEQITQDTAKETDLQEPYLMQRREKLAYTIKQLNLLTDENIIVSTTYVGDTE